MAKYLNIHITVGVQKGDQNHSENGLYIPFFWIIFFCAICLMPTIAQAQRPFTCEDQFFQTLTDSTFSALNEVEIDPNTGRVVFRGINRNLPFPVNAAGYRSTDNFIYCINPETYDLVRLDADGVATVLANLPLNRSFTYFAGDVSPDGKFLVLIGRRVLPTGAAVSADIARVDLESPSYVTTLSAINTNTQILDIAFHPVTEILYGYDSNQQRLVRIDINSGTVSTPFPPINAPVIVGALFFDAFANLFAYGSPTASSDQNTLYEIDPTSGVARFLTTGTRATSSDGCSCPYTIRLSKSVNPRVASSCSLVEYTFTMVNSSRRTQSGLRLEDALPRDFTFVSVKSNPLGGNVNSRPGDSSFSMDGFDLPSGKHEVTIIVRTGDLRAGIYRNQARLFGLPESLGRTRVSDNLATLIEDDSTDITLTRLPFDTLRSAQTLCNAAPSVVLNGQPFAAQTGAAATYLWPNGSTTATFNAPAPGTYPLKLISGCDTAYILFTVSASSIDVGLVRDTFTVALGDSLLLETTLTNTGTQVRYQWAASSGAVRCPTCPDTWALPVNDGLYIVRANNERGCLDSALARVVVRKNFEVFFPNVFKPNADADNANAYFYPSGPASTMIKSLSIFTRWGDKVFEGRDVALNTPRAGWDGVSRGQAAPPGVYVWVAEIEFLDGEKRTVGGDVTIVR
jgi:uncharacterized repeat protein (TIGR01451 family)